jgi:hypothetical protein
MFPRERRSSYSMSASRYITVGALSDVHGAIAKSQASAAVGEQAGDIKLASEASPGPLPQVLDTLASFVYHKMLLHVFDPSPC